MDATESISSYLNIPEERILKAVEKAGNRAVPQDIATIAGVDISKARTGLQNLASLTGGDLEVTDNGYIVYNFPNNFRTVLRSKSSAVAARESFEKVWPYVFYGVRVGFGVFLIASIVIVFTAIVALQSAGSSNDDDRRRGNGRGMGGGGMMFNPSGFFGPSPFDFFYYRPYYGYYSTPRSMRTAGPEEMGFLESTFSYIFGDGNPNADIEQQRLKLLASVIRSAGGAVTAEQLAPYLDPATLPPGYGPNGEITDAAVVDESFVLPAVTALRGVPEVTEAGDIVYTFPELQISAARSPIDPEMRSLEGMTAREVKQLLDTKGIPSRDLYEKGAMVKRLRENMVPNLVPPVLEEEPVKFSAASPGKQAAAAALGAVNLGGVLYLRGMLASGAFSALQVGGAVALAQASLPLLLGYAVAFNAIPLARYIKNKSTNAEIEKRNDLRKAWAAKLASKDATIIRKLQAAKQLSSEMKVLNSSEAAYTTAKDLTEQKQGENLAFDDFDKRMSKW